MNLNRVSRCIFDMNSFVILIISAACVLMEFLSGAMMGGAVQDEVHYLFIIRYSSDM